VWWSLGLRHMLVGVVISIDGWVGDSQKDTKVASDAE
jgi:hypothetical protein